MTAVNPMERGLPASIEAEKCVLSAVLGDPQMVPKAACVLVPDDFSVEAHRRIFRCVLERYESGASVDRISVAEHLYEKGHLESVGGLTFLSSLSDDSISRIFGIDSHVGIVRDKALLRRYLFAAQKLSDLCYQGDLSDVSGQADALLRGISVEGPSSVGLKHASEILREAGGPGGLFAAKTFGVPSPFPRLNELTCGFHPGQLIVVAGRPGKGKSAIASQFVEHAVRLNAGACPIFSLEMSGSSVLTRMCCQSAGVNSNLVRQGRLGREDRDKLALVATELAESPLYISDHMKVTLPAIHNALRWLKSQMRLALVCVDYLQLMSSIGRVENRTQEVSAISRGLKTFAEEFQVPFIVLSQFNREAVKEGRPQLHHLRDGGSIEQDCDVAILLHEPNGENGMDGWDVDALLDKQREGPTGTVELWFDRSKTRFESRGEHAA